MNEFIYTSWIFCVFNSLQYNRIIRLNFNKEGALMGSNNLWKYSPLTTVIILAPMVFSFALALDVYMPVIPQIVDIMNTTPFMVQLTLSLFILVTGFGQLIIGPLSDSFGRRKLIFISVLLFVFGSALCANATTINSLILFRIIQAIGACGTFVISFAIVRDVFHKEQSAQIYSFLNGMIAFSPLLGPIIGAYLDLHFDWRAPFIFLVVLGTLTAILILSFAKESLPNEKRKPFNKKLFQGYGAIVTNLQFIAYATSAAAGISAFFTFFSMTPYIITVALGLPEISIGFYFGLGGLTFMVGCVFSGMLVRKFGTFNMTIAGAIALFISGFSMLALHLTFGLTLWGFVGPSMLFTFGCALVTGAGAGGAMEPFGDSSGTAAAMFGAMEFGGSALIGSFVMLWPVRNTLPLAIEVLITSTLSISLLLLYRKYKNH